MSEHRTDYPDEIVPADAERESRSAARMLGLVLLGLAAAAWWWLR